MLTSSSAEALHVTGGPGDHGINREGQKPEIITRQATQLDLETYYGGPLEGTMRANIAIMDGEIRGVVGVVRERLCGKYFCDISPELQPYLRSITIMRAIKASLRFCDEYRGPLVAIADDAESCRLLNRLGFTHIDGRLYGWI